MSEMRLVVVGAAGRMGRMLIKAVAETEGCTLVGAIEREGSPVLGQDAGLLAGTGPLDVTVTDDPLAVFAKADGVLDFTAPAATTAFAALAAQARIVHVIGTTGLQETDAGEKPRILPEGGRALPLDGADQGTSFRLGHGLDEHAPHASGRTHHDKSHLAHGRSPVMSGSDIAARGAAEKRGASSTLSPLRERVALASARVGRGAEFA